MIFSTNLKAARNRNRFSQMKLAELADLSVGYICDLESGKRWGTPETFSKLANALKISPFELLIPINSSVAEVQIEVEKGKLLNKVSDCLKENILKTIDETVENMIAKGSV